VTPPSAPPRVLFFFGAMSPYSWLAAERIDELLPDARWQALFLGGLFKANGRRSWGLTEERARGLSDCEARACARGLGTIRWPERWPTSDLHIARALTAVSSAKAKPPPAAPGEPDAAVAGEVRLKRLALAAMRLSFLEGADLGELEVVLEAGKSAGEDPEELRQAIQRQSVKDALRSATDEALALGVFGVPTVRVGEQAFWGDDRLEEAAEARQRLDT
jgi:2-hydroxychromene-2-carboxylate isomerase